MKVYARNSNSTPRRQEPPRAGGPLAHSDGIRKYLPKSYRTAFNFTAPRTEFAKTDDSYNCAIQKSPRTDPTFKQSLDDIT
jgi:hypothetical protein